MSEDPVARGRRWSMFYEEEGGLKDIFDTIAHTYLERLAAIDPSDTDHLRIMALAHRVTCEARGMVQAIMANGEIAAKDKEYTTRMMAIPADRRRRF